MPRNVAIKPRLLDVHESGRYIGGSDKTIRALITAGEIPYIQRIPGRSPYLLDIRDLDAWIERNKVQAGQ